MEEYNLLEVMVKDELFGVHMEVLGVVWGVGFVEVLWGIFLYFMLRTGLTKICVQ